MYVCMWIESVYVEENVCMHAHIYVHIYIHTYMYMCACVSTYIHKHI